MQETGLTSQILFTLGPLQVSSTVVTTWIIMLLLFLVSWLATRKLTLQPGRFQTAIEGIVLSMEAAIEGIAPNQTKQVLPFIASLWIFLVIANLSGLIPEVSAPTGDLSCTSALAILVFLSVHWYGISDQGLVPYLKHYLSPSPILLPFNLISEVTRTVALAVRLFGNMLSLELAALFILLVAGFLAPIPILLLHIIEALVQAYIFGMLALVYLAGGIESQQLRHQESKGVVHD